MNFITMCSIGSLGKRSDEEDVKGVTVKNCTLMEQQMAQESKPTMLRLISKLLPFFSKIYFSMMQKIPSSQISIITPRKTNVNIIKT